MRSENVRSGDVRGLQQRMKIRDKIARRARHGDCRAPAQVICIKESSRTIVRANTSELGNVRKNGAHSRLEFGTPNVGVISVTGLQDHRRTARAATFEVHLAPFADVNQAGKITGRGVWSVTPPCVL